MNGRPVGARRLVVISPGRLDHGAVARTAGAALGLPAQQVAHPGDVSWDDLPDEFVIELDWPPAPWLELLLAREHIEVTLAEPALSAVLRRASSSEDLIRTLDAWRARPATIRVPLEDVDGPGSAPIADLVQQLRLRGAARIRPEDGSADGSADGSGADRRPGREPGEEVVRVAIIGTPRTGNTWVRRVLADVFELTELSVHRPLELPPSLPARCAIQLHWPRTPALQSWLAQERVHVISAARHPLDVLASILIFAQREPNTLEWLDGAGGTELTIRGAEFGDPAFEAYALGPRARALLSITPDWWDAASTIRVRYEDLAAHPMPIFGALCSGISRAFDAPMRRDLRAVIEHNSPERIHEGSGGVHVWHARPGMHHEVLASGLIARLAEAHGDVFARLRYPLPAALPGPLRAAD
jgi:hypothetical protein